MNDDEIGSDYIRKPIFMARKKTFYAWHHWVDVLFILSFNWTKIAQKNKHIYTQKVRNAIGKCDYELGALKIMTEKDTNFSTWEKRNKQI